MHAALTIVSITAALLVAGAAVGLIRAHTSITRTMDQRRGDNK